MGALAGSKRKPGTPVASPTKATASTKRSRTQYDYCDEKDSESLPEDQWSSDDADSWSDMSVDEDEDQTCQPDSPSGRKVADIQKELGRGMTTPKIEACTGCSCSRSGKQCNASTCSCQGGDACHNPLKKLDLAALFGQDAHAVELHPCFMTWITKQPKAKLERATSTRSLFDMVLDAIVMLDEYKSNATEPYAEWRTKWDGLTVSERDSSDAGLALKQELLRWGLTLRQSQSVYFSFCRRNGWMETDHDWHCDRCGGCRQWREWHCLNCDQCSYGLTLSCANCRGNGDWSPGFESNDGESDDDLHSFLL
ncbi:hypothetical protein DHEL01_v206335 [Diaporthe helianthi]|uniref:Tesmin/TSO1-like CXC domain-containing protein n=1 Tax=Diaporthe helianthi TaxID=158607 RepID=A0A2P5HYE9_DIAHE|nr:hypothetical protein DHEL01_v206335 [Diaporthe helianthi]